MVKAANPNSENMNSFDYTPETGESRETVRNRARKFLKVCISPFLTAILHRGLRNDFFLGLIYFPYSIWTFVSLFYLGISFFGLLFPFLQKSRSDLGFLPSILTTTSFRGHRIFVWITDFWSKSYECRKYDDCHHFRKFILQKHSSFYV